MAFALEPNQVGLEGSLALVADRLRQVGLINPTPIDLAHGTRPLGTWYLDIRKPVQQLHPCASPPLSPFRSRALAEVTRLLSYWIRGDPNAR